LLLSYQMDIQDVRQVTGPLKVTESKTPPAKKLTTKPDRSPQAEKKDPQQPAAQPKKTPADKQKASADDTKEPAEKKEPPAKKTKTPAKKSAARGRLPTGRLLAWAGPTLRTADPAPEQPKKTSKEPDAPQDSGKDAKSKAATSEAPKPEAPKPEAAKPDAAKPAEEPTGEVEGPVVGKKGTSAAPEAEETAERVAARRRELRTIAHLEFGDPINAPTLRDALLSAAEKAGRPLAEVVVDTDQIFDWEQDSALPNNEWYVNMVAAQEDAAVILKTMKRTLANTPVWPTSTRIGGKVAGDTQNLAIAALLTSLLGIVGYIWIRFQHVVFGVAAVIALVHDVLITLGAIAVSRWLAEPLGFLLIDEFKISLPIVAALLTIIGYSLNDTIVVFDRIREVRGKSPRLTLDMINSSINQTLGRTLLTSLTTLLVVGILYAIGGQGIHGFAFALVIGVLVGTYSSVFIASPALFWMMGRTKRGRSDAAATP
jgi:SecD/SecF fusion protein